MRIFVSYRRDDSALHTRSLRRRLAEHGPRYEVFRDVDHLLPGGRFRHELVDAVDGCDVVLVVVGRHWRAPENRRDGTTDYVWLELSTAVARGVPLVVALVDRGALPPPGEIAADVRDAVVRAPTARIDDADPAAGVARLAAVLDGLDVTPRGGPAPGVLRMTGLQKRSSHTDRRYVKVDGRKVGVLIPGPGHTDFPLPAGTWSITLGRGLLWSDPLRVTLEPGRTVTVGYRVTGIGRSSLQLDP